MTLSHIWNIIINSNTFNFIIFVAIFVWIFKKINISQAISSLQTKIIEITELAKKEKAAALTELKDTEKSVENLAEEIEIFLKNSENNAENIAAKIAKDTENQVISMKNNAKKLIEAEENKLASLLTKDTAKLSINSAKNKILSKLNENQDLHQKYIDESIEEIERLNF